MTILLGIVRRVSDRERTSAFYTLLGLRTVTHQHGGPLHTAVGPIQADFVVEVYKKSESYPGDALMIGVEDLALTLALLQTHGFTPHLTLPDLKSVYIKDPDGADVMLTELQ